MSWALRLALSFRAVCVSFFLCVSLCRLLLQNTNNWMAYKQQNFSSPPFWRLEVQNQDANLVGFWWSRSSGLQTILLTVFSHNEWGLGSSVGSFIKSINLIIEAPPSWPKHFPKLPSPNSITLGIVTLTYEFEGNTKTLTMAVCLLIFVENKTWCTG